MTEKYTPPPFGIYPPAVTFFNEDESVDYESSAAHIERLLDGGISGLVIHGSNGEAAHLLPDERAEVIRRVKAIIEKKQSKAVIIAGCTASSVRESLVHIDNAHKAGADYALILPPSYWAAAMSKPVIKKFYVEIANKSALPIVIYNFPGVVSGIDLDSDQIISITNEAPKVVGVKLTCGNLGKLQRLSATLPKEQFVVFGGKGDFLLPGLVAGSNGAISALANVVPKLHVELVKLYHAGDFKKAQEIQAKLSIADWELQKLGISGVKTVTSKYFGYGNSRARQPLPTLEVSALSADATDKLQPVIDLEKAL